MCDDEAIKLGEFQALRQEITNRLTISYTILGLGLAAFGTGFSVANRSSHVLAALSGVSALLWLYWTDNSLSIHRIAAYIAVVLAPSLNARDADVLTWESFFRNVCAGGDRADLALFRNSQVTRTRRIRPAQSADWYATVLFGGATPVLLSLYIGANVHHGAPPGPTVWMAAVVCAAIWAFAVKEFVRLVQERTVFRLAILSSGSAASGSATPSSAASPHPAH
ncbi:hypothetical protein [Actinomadura gamaensis]|uniref:Uncharacterized protein n=1 Tax=Actinomadura gamaensis TaxID=1763541 RepID=A0ABV9TTL2_9ACTN